MARRFALRLDELPIAALLRPRQPTPARGIAARRGPGLFARGAGPRRARLRDRLRRLRRAPTPARALLVLEVPPPGAHRGHAARLPLHRPAEYHPRGARARGLRRDRSLGSERPHALLGERTRYN